MFCGAPLEPCHVGECDGLDEVKALLPPGQLWNLDRGNSNLTSYFRALGHIKTELNKRICQEWNEGNPCTASRTLPDWAAHYSFPVDCVALTSQTLCQWIALVIDPACPVGSLGFLQAAIDFVLPGAGVTIAVNHPELFGNVPGPVSDCAEKNPLVITGPPGVYKWHFVDRDEPWEAADGVNQCRDYFIPEIECLRRCVFPFGLALGYKTNPPGPNGEDIFGVAEAANSVKPQAYLTCSRECP